MKQLLLLTLFCITILPALQAQQENRRTWAEGKLTWDDFKERQAPPGTPSEFVFGLDYRTERHKQDGVIIKRYMAYGFMDQHLSWVKPSSKTGDLLRYNQVLLDIVELYRRRFQMQLDNLPRYYLAQHLYLQVLAQTNRELDEFKADTQNGLAPDRLPFWEEKYRQALEKTPVDILPAMGKNHFGYGVQAGLGTNAPSGNLGQYFPAFYNMRIGLEASYRNAIFYLAETWGGARVKHDYKGEDPWLKNQGVTLAGLDASLGYAFIDNPAVKISSFVGLGYWQLILNQAISRNNYARLSDFSPHIGLNLDYKIRKTFRYIPDPILKRKGRLETSLRSRLYLSQVSFAPDLEGYLLNFSVGITVFSKPFRLTE